MYQMDSWNDVFLVLVLAFGLPVLGLFIVYRVTQYLSPGK